MVYFFKYFLDIFDDSGDIISRKVEGTGFFGYVFGGF